MFDALIDETLLEEEVRSDDLLGTDKTAVLLALRINGLGAGYDPKTKHTCPYCKAKFQWTFDLSELKMKQKDPFVEEAIVRDDGTFDFATERGDVLTLKYLTSVDESAIDAETEASKRAYKNKDMSFSIRLRHQIVALNGDKDKGKIREYISSGRMTMLDTTNVRRFLSGNLPEIELKQEITCPECREAFDEDIVINEQLFFPSY
jgi:hypothetical protein